MTSVKGKSVGYVPFTDQDAYPPAKDQYNAVPSRPASRTLIMFVPTCILTGRY